jgi:hypothetical protein
MSIVVSKRLVSMQGGTSQKVFAKRQNRPDIVEEYAQKLKTGKSEWFRSISVPADAAA